MTQIKPALRELGLSSKEIEVLLALYEMKKAPIAVLVRHCKLPRTTVYLLLAKLLDKQMALRVLVGKREWWEPVTPQRLLALKQDQVAQLKAIVPSLEQLVAIPEKTEQSIVSQYKGERGLQRVYDMILELGKGDRVFGFEGGRSSEQKTELLPQTYTRSWHEQVKRKGIILETVVSEKLLGVIQAASVDLLKAAQGRASITYVLPDEAMNFHSDILVFGRHVAIITPSRLSAVVITDSMTSVAFKHLLQVACMMGEKTDLNAFILKALKQKLPG